MPSSYSEIGKKQAGDVNILKLQDGVNRIRPLDNVVAGWRQHGIEHPSDDEQFASVVCPGPRSCPLCRKPVDAAGKQRFPMSRRYAANVWSYDASAVKVLVAGPTVFDEFKNVAQVGIGPDSCDWMILKSGQGIKTAYQVIRHDAAPFTVATITPEMLHDVAKYEQPASTEAIFEILEKFGIDYDTLDTPSYTYDEALAFKVPYGKHRGLTVEQLLATEADYALYIHSSKLEQGALGDPFFLALQVAMEEADLVAPLEDALAQLPSEEMSPQEPRVAAAPASPPADGTVTLISPIGVEVHVPPEAAQAMLGAGFTRPEPVATPVDANAPMRVLINGKEVELPREQALMLIDAGTAQATGAAPAESAAPAEPEFHLPLPDEEVEVNVAGTAVKMPFVQAQAVVGNPASGASYVDGRIAERLGQLAADPSGGAPTPASPPSTTPSAPDPEKPFQCEVCGAAYKTQGALTQHKNREHKAAEPQPSAVPAQNNGGGLADEVKGLINRATFAKDFTKVLDLMEEATGIRDFAKLSEEQLAKYRDRLVAEIALAQ